MGEWKRVRLGELTSIKTGKLNSCAAIEGGLYPFFTCAEFPLRINTAAYDSESVLVAGNCTPYVNYYNGKFNAYQRTYIITAIDGAAINTKWLYFWMRQHIKNMIALQSGSVEKYFVLSDFTESVVDLPDLPTQRRIAAVLGALDDKIEVNRKICENLEAQAQALFKAWFVDFVPFGGKRPEGWKMGKLGDVAAYYDGKIEATKLTSTSYFSTENMLANREGAVDAETVPQSGMVPLCDEGCVLVSNIRPYFKKIIRVNCDGGHSPDVLCFKAKALELQWYLYRMLWDDAFFAYVMSSTKGTKMPRGDKGHIMDYPCVLPFGNDIRKFNDTMASFNGRIEVANRESRALAAMRDALLPKLMRGEL